MTIYAVILNYEKVIGIKSHANDIGYLYLRIMYGMIQVVMEHFLPVFDCLGDYQCIMIPICIYHVITIFYQRLFLQGSG